MSFSVFTIGTSCSTIYFETNGCIINICVDFTFNFFLYICNLLFYWRYFCWRASTVDDFTSSPLRSPHNLPKYPLKRPNSPVICSCNCFCSLSSFHDFSFQFTFLILSFPVCFLYFSASSDSRLLSFSCRSPVCSSVISEASIFWLVSTLVN